MIVQIWYPVLESGSKKTPCLGFEGQKVYPDRRHVSVWHIYGITPPPPSLPGFPYTKQLLKVSDNSVQKVQHESTTLKTRGHSHFLIYSLSPGFWRSFISIEVCRDRIPALASSCKKQLTGFFVCLLFFLKVKRIS